MDLDRHLAECDSVRCSMAAHGCPFVGTLSLRDAHEPSCPFVALRPFIEATHERLERLCAALPQLPPVPTGTLSIHHSPSVSSLSSQQSASLSSSSSSSSSFSLTPSSSSTDITSKDMSLIEVKHRRFEMAFKYLSHTLEETRKELKETQNELRRFKAAAAAVPLSLAPPPISHLIHGPPIQISPPLPDALSPPGHHHDHRPERSQPHRQHSHSDLFPQTNTEIKCIDTLDEHVGPVWALASSHDGGFLVSGSSDSTVRVWSFTSGKCLHVFQGHEQDAIVHSVAVHRSDKIFSGASDKQIKVWSLRSRECVHTMETRNLVCRLVTAAGRYLLSGSYQEISVWDLSSYELLHTIKGLNHWVRSLVVAPSTVSPGTSLLYAGAHNSVKVFSITGGEDSFECLRTVEGAFSSIYGLEIANNMLFSATFEHLIHVLDLTTFRPIAQLRGHTGVVYCLCVSNGKLFSGSYDQTIRVWSVDTLRCIAVLRAHTSSVDTIITSIDNRVYSGSADKRILCWQT